MKTIAHIQLKSILWHALAANAKDCMKIFQFWIWMMAIDRNNSKLKISTFFFQKTRIGYAGRSQPLRLRKMFKNVPKNPHFRLTFIFHNYFKWSLILFRLKFKCISSLDNYDRHYEECFPFCMVIFSKINVKFDWTISPLKMLKTGMQASVDNLNGNIVYIFDIFVAIQLFS